MLEGLVEKLILAYFGDFIENLDKSKLSLGIWSGNLVLEDIVLNPKAINEAKLPFKLTFGRLGKLSLQIPWKNNFSSPTKVDIESVQVLLTLIKQDDWEYLDFHSFDVKNLNLSKFAAKRMDELNEAFSKNDKTSGYLDRVIIKILDNLHVNIKNVNIRIEEENKTPLFSLGLTLEEVMIVNTNENWEEIFIDRNYEKNIDIFKVLKIVNFGIYLIPYETYLINSKEKSKKELQSQMCELYPFGETCAKNIEYLNNKTYTEISEQIVRANIWITLDKFEIEFQKSQFDCLVRIMNHTSNYQKFQSNYYETRRFLYFKPKYLESSKKEDDKLVKKLNNKMRWRFATNIIIRRLKFIKGNYDIFNIPQEEFKIWEQDFTELYKKYYKDPKSLTSDELTHYKRIISLNELPEIYSWAKPVLQEIYTNLKKEEKKKIQKGGFFSSMFSSKVEIPEEELISKEEMEKIELILGNAIKDAQNKLISNNIETKLQIDFLLREGSFIFSKSNLKNNILTSESFAFSYSDLSFSMRKGELFSNVESQLKSFNVELQTIINKYKTTLPITFLEESQRNTDFVFLFKFRQNAPKDEINSKLELTVNNLNLLYHQVFLERIIKFLTVDLNEDIVSKAWEKWYVIKEEASEELKKALAKKNIVEIKVSPRKVVIPINKYDFQNSQMLVVDIGEINIFNGESEKRYTEIYDLDVSRVNFYHYFSFKDIKNGPKFNILTEGLVKLKFKLLDKEEDTRVNPKAMLTLFINNVTIHLTEYLFAICIFLVDIMKPALEPDLWSQLNHEQNEIKKQGKAFGKLMKKNNEINVFWQEYYGVLSGGYIYFYNTPNDDDFIGYYYIKDAEIKTSTLHNEEVVTLINKFGKVSLKFPNEQKKKSWIKSLSERINEMKTSFEIQNTEMKKEKEAIESDIKIDLNEIIFAMDIKVNNVNVDLYDVVENAKHKYDKIFNINVTKYEMHLDLREADIDFQMGILGVKIFNEKSMKFYQIFDSVDPDKTDLKLFSISIFVSNERSPKYKGVQIDIDVKIGYMYATWWPDVMRRLLSFLAHNDFMRHRIRKEIDVPANNTKEMFIEENTEKEEEKRINCEEHKEVWIKVKMNLKKVRVIWLQPLQLFMFTEIRLGETEIICELAIDHMIIKGNMGNTQILDLSNYPYTITDQESYDPANIKEIFGFKNKSSFDFYYKSMNAWCPQIKNNYNYECDVTFNSVIINYQHEHFFRIFNYIFAEFLGSMTANQEVKKFRDKKNKVKVKESNEIDFMRMNVVFNNPQVLLKARPHFQEHFLIDLGTVTITNSYKQVPGKYRNYPEKLKWVSSYCLSLKNLYIITKDKFPLAPMTSAVINMHMTQMTDEEKKLTDLLFDKSWELEMIFDKLKLNLRQCDFTNLMKFNDLNFMYQDYLGEFYDYYTILKSKETDPDLVEFRASKLDVKSIKYDKESETTNRESKFSEDDFKEKEIMSKINNFIAKLLIPEFSICLYQNEKIFTELVLFEKSLIFCRKANNTKEIDIIIKKIEIYHYIDNYNKEPILSDFLNPNAEQGKWLGGKGTEKGRVNQFDMKLLIDVDREKSYMIKINNIKSIFRIDNFYLIKNFFTEGFPFYDEVGQDLPNQYDPNEDNYPGMKVYIEIKNPLLCFLSDNLLNYDQDLFCLSSEIVIGFKRERISKVKQELVQNFKDLTLLKEQVTDQAQKEELANSIKNEKQDTYSMTVSLFDVCPFICNMNDVIKKYSFTIPKRKIMDNFILQYESKYFLQCANAYTFIISNANKLDLMKTTIKCTYRDLVLILKTVEFNSNLLNDDYKEKIQSFVNLKRRAKQLARISSELDSQKLKKLASQEVEWNASQKQDQNLNNKKQIVNGMEQKMNPIQEREEIEKVVDHDQIVRKPKGEISKTIVRRSKEDVHYYPNNDTIVKSTQKLFQTQKQLSQIKLEEIDEPIEDEFTGQNLETDENLGCESKDPNVIPFHLNSFQKFKNEDIMIDKGFGIFTVISEGLQIILIDDHSNTYYPFLSIIIHEMNIIKEEINFHQAIVNSNIQVKIVTYNYYAGVWEPLVEKTNIVCEMVLDRSDEKVYTKTINIVIPSSKLNPNIGLNINISDLTFCFLYSTLTLWTEKYKKLQQNYTSEVKNLFRDDKAMAISNHKIVNYTGRTLKLYRVIRNKGTNQEFTKLANLIPNETYDIEYFEENESKEVDLNFDLAQNLIKENYICFELDYVDASKISENIFKIDNIQTKIHHINYKDIIRKFKIEQNLKPYEYVISDIQYHDLKKFIYFYAPLVFKNKTQHSLMITLMNKNMSNLVIFLEPKKLTGIPYEYLEGNIEFQYSDSEAKAYKIRDFLNDNFKKKEVRLINTFFNLIVPEKKTKYKLIYITTSYIIRNCLPFDIMVNIQKTKQNFLITKSEKVYLDNLSFQESLVMNIKFLEFENKEELVLYSIKDKHAKKSFKMFDKKGNYVMLLAQIYNEDTDSKTIVLFSSGIIINNSLLDIKFFYDKGKKNIEIAGQREKGNVLLISDEKHIILQVDKNIKSTPQSLNAIGIQTVVECANPDKSKILEISMYCHLSLVAQDLELYTTVITFSPTFVIYNKLNLPLLISLQNNNGNTEKLEPDCKKPFYFFGATSRSMVCFRPIEIGKVNYKSGSKWNWSGAISLIDTGLLTIQLNGINPNDKKYLNLEKKIVENVTFVIISEAKYETSQFVIENTSNNLSIKIWQKNYIDNADYIDVRSKCLFAWSDHYATKVLFIEFFIGPLNSRPLSIKDAVRSYKIFEDKIALDSKNPNEFTIYPATDIIQLRTSLNKGIVVKMKISTDGMKKTIKFGDIINEVIKLNSKKMDILEINLKVERMGISIISDNKNLNKKRSDYRRYEIIYIVLKNIYYYSRSTYQSDTVKSEMQVKVRDLQVDNDYTYITQYPIVMKMQNIEKNEKQTDHLPPFFNMAIIMQKNTEANGISTTKIILLNYLLQTFTLSIESDIIDAFLNFIMNLTIQLKTSITEINPLLLPLSELKKKNQSELIRIEEDYYEPGFLSTIYTQDQSRIYIQTLETSSIEIIFSFTTQNKIQLFHKILTTNPILSGLLSTLSNVEKASIMLNGSQLHNIYGDLNDIINQVLAKYKQDILVQIMKIFGAIDIFGNPIRLIQNLGTGVQDFFQKPIQGIIKGPLEGAVGVVDGSFSLVRHTVDGTFGAASKITSGISKGILHITQDEDYINDQEKKKITERPKNFVEGLGYGISRMTESVFSGVTDVVIKPYEGAKKNDIKGFGKGLFQGLAGLIIKPVSGILELVSKTTEGIKNTMTSDDPILKMERKPRAFYGKFKFIKSYNAYHADVIDLISNKVNDLKDIKIDFYSSEIYKNHKDDTMLIIFTTNSIMIMDLTRKELKAIINYDEIKDIKLEKSDKIRISFNKECNGKTSAAIFFSQHNSSATLICQKMREAVEHNFDENFKFNK